jgi:hypothetical protein
MAYLQGPELSKAIDTSTAAIFALPGLTCAVSESRVYALAPVTLRDKQPGERLWCETFAPLRYYWFSAPDAPEGHDDVIVDEATARRLADGGELIALAIQPEMARPSPMFTHLRTSDPELVNGQIIARDPSAPDSIVHAGQILNASDIEAALPGFTIKREIPDRYAVFRDGKRVGTVSGYYYGHVASANLTAPGLATVDGVQVGDPFAAIAGMPNLKCWGDSPNDMACSADVDGTSYWFNFRTSLPAPRPDPYERIFGEDDAPHGAPARRLTAASAKRVGRKAKISQINIHVTDIRPRSE